MTKRVTVLGGSGFIGSHLVERLVSDGLHVRVFDRKGDNSAKSFSEVDYRFADLSDLESLADSLVDTDIVVHLISTSVPSTANLDPLSDIQGNLVGTVKLLQQMQELGVPRLIFLSSGGTVYGNAKIIPTPEDHKRNPISSYGIIKSAIEDYIHMFCRLYGLKALIVRPSNPYGPRQGHIGVHGVIPTFFQHIVNGNPIPIYGDGTIIRDYIYIIDLIDFLSEAISLGIEGVYNVGSGLGSSLLDIIEVIKDISGLDAETEFYPYRGFDVKEIVLDIAKARRDFNWEPKESLRSGCLKYWKWMSENII